MAATEPDGGWGETPKERLKREIVEKWRVNVVPGASPA
jgi:hypothetical protein